MTGCSLRTAWSKRGLRLRAVVRFTSGIILRAVTAIVFLPCTICTDHTQYTPCALGGQGEGEERPSPLPSPREMGRPASIGRLREGPAFRACHRMGEA